jgi:hypothetical protein
MRRALVLAGLASLLACRQIAGIEDIKLTSDAGGGTDAGSVQVLTTASSGEALTLPIAMFVTSGYVVVVTESSVWRCPTTGCAKPEVIVPSFAGLTLDATLVGSELYFTTNENNGTIRAVGIDGKNARVYKLAPGAEGIASDGTNVFWATRPEPNPGQLVRCPVGTTCATPTAVIDSLQQVQGSAFAAVVVFAGNVYTNVTNTSASAIERLVSCGTTATCGATPKTTSIVGDGFGQGYFRSTPTRLLFTDANSVSFYDTALKLVVVASSSNLSGAVLANDDARVVTTNFDGDVLLSVPFAGPPQLRPVTPKQANNIDVAAVDGGFVYFVATGGAMTLARAPLP